MTLQISNQGYNIEVGHLIESSLQKVLTENYSNAKKIILVDENIQKYCLDYLLTQFDLSEAEIVTVPAGEESKTIDICVQIWEALSSYDINRNDLMINLGGGMITDLGGFIASTYKRGIDFINIPTSLLGMVDASIGGKTGIDLNNYKNQIGVFSNPKLVICDSVFLKTLPEEEFLSGKAEMLKHSLINSEKHWNIVKDLTPKSISDEYIAASIQVKNDLVLKDPKEKNDRKKLNLGHTIGHALEMYLLTRKKQPHGYCVAWGIVTEAYLSFLEKNIKEDTYKEIYKVVSSLYPKPDISKKEDIKNIIDLMKNDKKNNSSEINFNLLKGFGNIEVDYHFAYNEIHTALKDIFATND